MLRFHGSRDKVTYEQVGYNSRLDELQAAILRVQLPELDALGRRPPRRRRATTSRRASASSSRCRADRPGARPAWHLYVVRHERADDAGRRAAARPGSARAPTTARPIHRQPAMAALRAAPSCPATDELARTHLAIPMSAAMRRDQVDEVVARRARCASGST